MLKAKYIKPKADDMQRRVYMLPTELVLRIHSWGRENGHQSEVSAVRSLLDLALNAESESGKSSGTLRASSSGRGG